MPQQHDAKTRPLHKRKFQLCSWAIWRFRSDKLFSQFRLVWWYNWDTSSSQNSSFGPNFPEFFSDENFSTKHSQKPKGLWHAPWVRGAPRRNTRAPPPCTRTRRRPEPARLLHAVCTSRGHLARALPAAAAELPTLPRALVRAVARGRPGARPCSALRAQACRAIHVRPVRPVPPRPRASQNVRAPPPLAHLSPPGCMRQGPAGG